VKLSPRDAEAYFRKPDPDKAGILIHGVDAMRVALRRQEVLAALLGPKADEEMRLTRLSGAELRKEPALLLDAIKAVGFFPGPRAVLVDEAGEGNGAAIATALADWAAGDAQIVVTAGQLRPTSKLRKLFEAHASALAAAIYDDPPSRQDVERQLAKAGLASVSGATMAQLLALANEISPGDFRQLLEKIALYKLGDHSDLTPEEIEACAPQSLEAGIDDLLAIVAEARHREIGPVMQRLKDQGTSPVGLTMAATRHLKLLYAIASDPGGAAAGAGRLRPPAFGKRRDQLVRQAQLWGARKLQTGLTLLTDTDLQLRSAGQNAPAMALVERALIRLAMLAERR
jgi:DNA polymerase-3 subunit delta